MLKKLMSVVLVGLLTLGSITAMATAEVTTEPVEKLVLGFEDETVGGEEWLPTGWELYSATSVDINTTETASMPKALGLGNNCLEFDSIESTNAYGSIKYPVALKPNTTYALSAWTRGEAGENAANAYVYGRITLATKDQAAWFSTQYLARVHSPSSDANSKAWHRLYTTYTTGAEAVEGYIYIRDYAGAKIWYDGIALYEISEEEMAQATINGGFEDLTITGTEEKIVRPLGWTYGYSVTDDEESASFAVITTEKVRSGQYALKMQSDATNTANNTLSRQVDGLTPGKTYMITSYANILATSTFGYVITARQTTDTWPSWATMISTSGNDREPTNGAWKPMTATFIAPASGSAKIYIYVNTKSNPAPIYIDDISITEVPDEGLFDVTFLDENGKKLDKLAQDKQNKVKLFVNGVNLTNEAKTYTVACVTYTKEGEALEMQTVSLTQKEVKALANVPYNATSSSATVDYNRPGHLRDTIDVEVSAGQILKVFVFDDLGKLSMLSAYTLD